MLDWLRRLLSPAPEDFQVENEAVSLKFNHVTKVALMMAYDPATTDDQYKPLADHLAKRGYFLQIAIPSVSLPREMYKDKE